MLCCQVCAAADHGAAQRLRAELRSPRGPLRGGGAGVCGCYSVQRQPFQLKKLAGCPFPAFQASGLRSAASLGCAQEAGMTCKALLPEEQGGAQARSSSQVGGSLVPLRPESPSLPAPGLLCTPGRVSPAFAWSKGEGWVCAEPDRGPFQMQEYVAHPIHGFSHLLQLGPQNTPVRLAKTILLSLFIVEKIEAWKGLHRLTFLLVGTVPVLLSVAVPVRVLEGVQHGQSPSGSCPSSWMLDAGATGLAERQL